MIKKLSSENTFIYKRIYPLVWFGTAFVLFGIGLSKKISGESSAEIFLMLSIGIAILSYFTMKVAYWDLIDAVYDEGDALLFNNKGKELRVKLKDVKKVTCNDMIANSMKVVLSVRYKTDFGYELSFLIRNSWLPFGKNEEIGKLINRIDAEKG